MFLARRSVTMTVELYTDAGRLVDTTVTDLLGKYWIASVFPGTYFLRTRNDRGYVDAIFANTTCASCDIPHRYSGRRCCGGCNRDRFHPLRRWCPVRPGHRYLGAGGWRRARVGVQPGRRACREDRGQRQRAVPRDATGRQLSGVGGCNSYAPGRNLQRAALHQCRVQCDGGCGNHGGDGIDHAERQLHARWLQRTDDLAAASGIGGCWCGVQAGVLGQWRHKPMGISDHGRGAAARRRTVLVDRRALGCADCAGSPRVHRRSHGRERLRNRAACTRWTSTSARSRCRPQARHFPQRVATSWCCLGTPAGPS